MAESNVTFAAHLDNIRHETEVSGIQKIGDNIYGRVVVDLPPEISKDSPSSIKNPFLLLFHGYYCYACSAYNTASTGSQSHCEGAVLDEGDRQREADRYKNVVKTGTQSMFRFRTDFKGNCQAVVDLTKTKEARTL